MTVNRGRSWSPGQPLKPECVGCGHDPHAVGACRRLLHVIRSTCRCPIDDRPCTVKGCGHSRLDHRMNTTPGDATFCRTCFDIYPTDDSLVEGGVYHPFNGERQEVRTINDYAMDPRD